MLALTILLFGLIVFLVMATVLFVVCRLTNLLALVVPVIPLLAMVGSALLGLIEMFLFFGKSEDRRLAKRELAYLGATFAISAILWWVCSYFLLKL
jgi:hypothetical protein